MNWSIFITIAILGFGVGILLTLKNKPISKNSEINLLRSVKTIEELESSSNNSNNNFEKLLNMSRKKQGFNAEIMLQEYLHPENQTKRVNQQKLRGGLAGFALMLISFILLQGQARILGVVFPVLGYAAPMFLFNSKRKKMQRTVVEAIPDLLGYMAIFISSMSLYKTLDLILSHTNPRDDNILYASLRQSVKEHQFGRDLFESLEAQASALGVQEWISCVFTLNEGVKLGKDLRAVILEIEEDYRNERKLKLEMEASQVTTKLSLISSMMFMPAIYTYTMVPAYMQLFKVL